MYSNLIPFENIVDAISDATGIKNLRNHYPQIRRFIRRSEKDIGYGSTLLLKRITYKISDGTILPDSNGGPGKIKLPDDLVSIEAVGMCYEGICPENYVHQGQYLFLCNHFDEFSLIYYSLLCDGNGNPTVSENHEEAVIAGVLWRMYQPKIWNREGDRTTYKELNQEYEDRCGEARGKDVMPTEQEWSKIASILRSSSLDLMVLNKEKCYMCVPEYENKQILDPSIDTTNDMVYFWQYDDLSIDISDAPNIDQLFLDSKSKQPIQVFIDGYVISYNAIGRIAIAISNVNENQYQIIDVFETDITSVVFDTYYDTLNRTQIYISKEIYSHGNIYYKLILN